MLWVVVSTSTNRIEQAGMCVAATIGKLHRCALMAFEHQGEEKREGVVHFLCNIGDVFRNFSRRIGEGLFEEPIRWLVVFICAAATHIYKFVCMRL